MKTINKLLALTILFASMLLNSSTIFSQCNDFVNLAVPFRYEAQLSTGQFFTITQGSPNCSSPGTGFLTMPGMGVNQDHPLYMLDIFCDPSVPTNMDVNISSNAATGIPANAAGYRLGGKQMLFTLGDDHSVFGGLGTAAPTGVYAPPGVGGYNTFLGYKTYDNLTTGTYITAIGGLAGTQLTVGALNTLVGAESGRHLIDGAEDTYIGYQAGFTDTSGEFNTFVGWGAGYSNDRRALAESDNFGLWNTMEGYECGYKSRYGFGNNFYGKAAGYWDNGFRNCMFGAHAGDGGTYHHNVAYYGDSNCFMGHFSAYQVDSVLDDVFIGTKAAYRTGGTGDSASNWNVYVGGLTAQTNPGGIYNILLGFRTDAYDLSMTGVKETIRNSVAIGADALVQHDNQFILGNNRHFVGIGMVGDLVGPMANLEIETEQNDQPPPISPGTNGYIGIATPSLKWLTHNYYYTAGIGGTGFSGLKFRDLNSNSTPVDPSNLNFSAVSGNPYPSGMLSVDGYGNVIYVPNSSVFGNCASPTSLTQNADVLLNSKNYYFDGNLSSSSANNSIVVGNNCTHVPLGKIDVYQNSGDPLYSCGIYIANQDARSYNAAPYYGIQCYVPAGIQTNCVANIGGYFDATGALPSTCAAVAGGPIPVNYALFVPPYGGGESIGFPYGSPFNDASTLLMVSSGIMALTTYYPSDSILKKDVAPLNHGLDVIRKLQTVSYKYNGKAGIDTFGTHYGLIAQNLQRVAPYAVGNMTVRLDTSSSTRSSVLKIDNNAVMYTAINAIKQLDSIVTVKSAKIDSLTNALQSIQSCLNQLCGQGHSRTRNNNGGGGDSNTTVTNIQDVSLSMANAPLLYQNIPNPFSQNTKINYYLPEGVQGAYIVFYDNYGNQMKQVQLSQTGNGTLNITPENLTSGIYSYSLVVNNKVIDTKRMLLQK